MMLLTLAMVYSGLIGLLLKQISVAKSMMLRSCEFELLSRDISATLPTLRLTIIEMIFSTRKAKNKDA
jgi:hypothetical protein